MPNFIKIGQTVAEREGDLTVFKMVAVRHLGFAKFKFFNGHQHRPTKFHRDRSNHCGDIAIFVIFQDGGRRHLGFQNFEILTVDLVPASNMRHRGKFHQDRSNGRRYMLI